MLRNPPTPLRDPETPVKIYFCDICNQSIPLKDLDEGQAVAVKGKLLCAACSSAASGTRAASIATAAPTAATSAASGGGTGSSGRLLGGIALAVIASAGVSLALLSQKEKELRNDLETLRRDARKDLSLTEDRIQTVQAEAISAQRGVDSLTSELRTAKEEHSGRREHDQAELAARFERVTSYVTENEKLKDSVHQLQIQLAASQEQVASLQKELNQVRGSLADLAARPVAAAPAPAPVEAAPVEPSSLPPLPADLQKHAGRLKSSDPAERWEAVGEIARGGNDKVIPYLLPLLKDTDDFVRHHTAEILGDLDARVAIPHLIDALADEQLFVREMVFNQLRKISRKNDLKFEPSGKSDDRAKQIKLWRTWWEKEQGGAAK